MKVVATLAALLFGVLASKVDVPLWKKELTKVEYDVMHLPSVFESWMKDFNKLYEHEEEKIHRFQVWLKNLEYIAVHNSKQDETYKMRMNQFGDLTSDEFVTYVHGKKGKCYSGANTNTRRLKVGSSFVSNKLGANPTSIDWTNMNGKSYVTPVKNQGSCGSCWSFSATGSIECRTAIATGNLISLSEQQLVDCSYSEGDLGCDGGEMDDAFKYVEKNGGLCTEAEYPYEGVDGKCKASSCGTYYSNIASYTDVTVDDEADLETATVSGCVSVAVEADQSSFQFYSSGVLTGNCGTNLDHGVLVVGYGTTGTMDYWKVKNSWGTSWGEEGYLLICKDCDKNGSKGECGINMDPSFPVH
jgi:KDEL-tailed cysteine endopeptidase